MCIRDRMYVIPMDSTPRGLKKYIVVGSCCETGDIMTPAPQDPENVATRLLTEAKVGDLFVIGGSGAYCSSMSPSNYNSHLKPAEFLIRTNGEIQMIKKRQELEDLWKSEMDLKQHHLIQFCLLYTSPSPRALSTTRMPSSA
eukprot:TRINITY_DN19272_c0_g1_i1.p1 TRINITY_DN19272_c0_g1~~TRINITY_DN19272_c0_g1_i1.p1  ORF type:complete len:142 (+),score=49.42 TRINITY_DN19272_c0_g1_i1:64-489(+)